MRRSIRKTVYNITNVKSNEIVYHIKEKCYENVCYNINYRTRRLVERNSKANDISVITDNISGYLFYIKRIITKEQIQSAYNHLTNLFDSL